jgi:hypothetical protein
VSGIPWLRHAQPLLRAAQRLILARVGVLLFSAPRRNTVRLRLLSVALIASFLAANVAAAATNTSGQHHPKKGTHSGQHSGKKHHQHSGTHKKNSNKLHSGQ